jgi:hypothetical protein
MQLLVRSNDGSLRRPRPERPFPDFGGEDDGQLVFVHAGVSTELSVYLSAGDDTHPPTHSSYEAELHVSSGRFVVRTLQRSSNNEVIEWRVSEDGGRSWRAVSTPPPLDEARLLDRITAG